MSSRWLHDTGDEDPKICLTGVRRALAIACHDCPSNDGGVHPNSFSLFESNNLTLLRPITSSTMPTVHLLDYVAGNVRSLVNAIEKVGYTVEWVKTPADVPSAEVPRPSHQDSRMNWQVLIRHRP